MMLSDTGATETGPPRFPTLTWAQHIPLEWSETGHFISPQLLQHTVPVMPTQGTFCARSHPVAYVLPSPWISCCHVTGLDTEPRNQPSQRECLRRPWETEVLKEWLFAQKCPLIQQSFIMLTLETGSGLWRDA